MRDAADFLNDLRNGLVPVPVCDAETRELGRAYVLLGIALIDESQGIGVAIGVAADALEDYVGTVVIEVTSNGNGNGNGYQNAN